MKKGFVFSLMAVLALAGCQTRELDYAPQQESKHFTATIEDDFNSGDTRTYMDENGNVRWKQGDQVSIFAGDPVNEQYQVTDASDGKTSAAFNKLSGGGFVGGGEIDNNVAFYPYASTAEIAKSGSAYVISDITLPATQSYAEASFGNGAFPMAAVTSDTEDMHLKFKNVLGGLKLQLKGTASIASISVTGNRDEVFCGAAAVTVSNGSAPSINLTDATAKTVTLDCGDGVQLNAETATAFVIALPPMTMEGGFTVVVTDTDGGTMEIKTTKTQTINRSSLLKMPAVDYVGESIQEATPLKFTSSGSTNISLTKTGSVEVTLECKVGDGEWSSYTVGDAINLTDGQEVSFRAGASGNASFCHANYEYLKFTVTGSGTVAASGNIMSLLDKKGGLTIPTLYCFYGLFKGCTSLTSAPELPATTLAGYCYSNMFDGCTGLTSAPELPATTLAHHCYASMFSGCTGLASAPELPATTLAAYCYSNMFDGCTGLTSAPELPATTLAYNCYFYMFRGCTGLTSAPELPATTLAAYCYVGMFIDCTGLTYAPELPVTTLAESCYSHMFKGCTGLTSAPELPATTLVDGCYSYMFYGCTNLNYIKALFTTKPYWLYTDNWVSGVAATGTFVKSSSATWDVTGIHGIPSGWTVIALPDAIDLGLSVKWASFNLGASNPEEYGDYYAWGETEPKSKYDWDTYKWCMGSESTLTKYCPSPSYGYNGFSDTKTVLDSEDDAAHMVLGGEWRMPTTEEWEELFDNCSYSFDNTLMNGVYVLKVTGPNGNSVFFPAAGHRNGYALNHADSECFYWSSSLHPSDSHGSAVYMEYYGSGYYCSQDRCSGLSIRPVTE